MKVVVIGLDSAPPQLVFDRWRDELPTLGRLMATGAWGPLESSNPPITVPAWSCMMSSRDPGELGIYGFRNRKDHSYDGYTIANANAIRVDRAWDVIGRAGKQVILLGVPQTYPPKPVNGCLVTDFLTPSTQSQYTHPPALKEEVERVAEGYVLDVEDFRTPNKQALLDRVYAKTRKHFRVARHLAATKPWDFFMMVEMGMDRLHHVFWHYFDPKHPLYQAGNPFEDAFQRYYRALDDEVGALLELLPEDAITIVMSDHGARPMMGGICFNDWLIENGYLTLKEPASKITPIAKAAIDWGRTAAWGDGGYYGRLFLNVAGREPQGVIPPAEYETVRDELAAKLVAMPGPEGEPLGTKVHKPQDVYPEVRGVAPDLLVYFGDLEWRSVGAVGNPSVYTFENDIGPDGANHDRTGVFAMKGAPGQPIGKVDGLNLVDVGPTILSLYGIDSHGATSRSFL